MLQRAFLETQCLFEKRNYRLARTVTWLEALFRPAYLSLIRYEIFVGHVIIFSKFSPL